jgi:hypothetical protein
MLESISLKFTEQATPIVVPAQGITIFVGPNNSGKSLVLRELDEAISTNGRLPWKLLENFEIIWPTPASLDNDLAKLAKKAPPGVPIESAYIGRFRPDGSLEGTTHNREAMYQLVQAKNKNWVTSQFLKFFQIKLDGRTRFELTNDQPIGDLVGIPQNVLAHIFQNDDLRTEIRELVFDAFGVYFVVDPLLGGVRFVYVFRRSRHRATSNRLMLWLGNFTKTRLT